MKWRSGWKRYQDRDKLGYQPWFAWYPVITQDQEWIWLENVERKPWGYTGIFLIWWEYRKINGVTE